MTAASGSARGPRNRSWWLALAGVAVVAVCLGLLVGLALAPARTPARLSSSVSAGSVKPARMVTRDDRAAKLVVVRGRTQSVTASASGVVTTSDCVGGGAAVSGASGFSVNDEALVYFASSEPIWRPLSLGDRGDDVRSAQAELARLGYPVTEDGVVGRQTLAAFGRLLHQAGRSADAAPVPAVDPSALVWIPSPSTPLGSCSAAVGDRVQHDGELAKSAPIVSSAVLASVPANAIPGARVVAIGGVEVPVDGSGAVAPAELASIPGLSGQLSGQLPGQFAGQASGDDQAAGAAGGPERSGSADDASRGGDAGPQPPQSASPSGSGPVSVSVQYRLAKEQTVFSLPAAAVGRSGDGVDCVASGARRYAVDVVGAELGQSLVVFRQAATPARVTLSPRIGARCG